MFLSVSVATVVRCVPCREEKAYSLNAVVASIEQLLLAVVAVVASVAVAVAW